MKKIWKRTLALLLAVIMIGGAAPAAGLVKIADWLSLQVSAANYSGNYGANGSKVTWSLNTSTGVLTISGTGKMKDYYYDFDGYYAPWYSYRLSIKTVTIENGVTSIGTCAFYNFTKLTSVTIGNSVTSIGNYAFSGCTGLTSVNYTGTLAQWCGITFYSNPVSYAHRLYINGQLLTGDIVIPDSVTSIGDRAFSGCTGLTSVTISDSVTSIGSDAFYGCTGLTSVNYTGTLAQWCGIAFSNSYGNPVYYAHKLYINGQLLTGDIVIPDSVTSIGDYAFYNCTGLTSVTIPDSVTSIGYSAFYDCTGLTSVNYTGTLAQWCGITFYSNPVSYAHRLYINGQLLTGDIVIPDSVTSIGNGAFSGCTELTSVTIPDSVTSIGGGAFYGCTGLTSINIPDSVTSIGYSAFYDCTGITSINIPDSVTSIGNSAFYNCTGLTNVTIPDSVTSIGDKAFYYCKGLTSVTIPNSVTSIGDYAFYNCTGLTNVTIPDSVTSIGSDAFYGCKGLTSINIPDNVTRIYGYTFYGCTGLTSVTIGNSVTSIGSDAFYGCTGLTSVNYTGTLAQWCGITFYSNPVSYAHKLYINGQLLTGDIVIPDSVTSIGRGAFYGCTGLTSITIPDSVTSIGSDAFYGVRNIIYSGGASGSPWGAQNLNGYMDGHILYESAEKKTLISCETNIQGSVTIPNSVTSIGRSAFYNCTGLTSVTIPNSVTSIGRSAFYNCTGLTSVTIPNSVTSIGNNAFYNCTGITSINIPNSVTSIGSSAFYNCTGLTNITLPYVGLSKNATGADSRFGAIFGYDQYSSSVYYYIPSSLRSVTLTDCTTIPNSAFSNCSMLTDIIIPDSVTSIGDRAFYNCKGLTSITIPDSVTSIGSNAFYGVINIIYSGGASGSPWGAQNLNGYMDGHILYESAEKKTLIYCETNIQGSVTIPDSVTSIGGSAFYNCKGLTSITIPDSVTSIGEFAFSECGSLADVTMGSGVTSIGECAFYDCTGLTSVTIPDSVTSIGDYAFYGCTGLTSVTIPESVTSIGGSAFSCCASLASVNYNAVNCFLYDPVFRDCDALKTVIIGEDVTVIPEWAFYGCTGLPSIIIPNSVTSIGNSAFYNCLGLTSMTIPNSVTSIGEGAFSGCTGLTSVTIGNGVTSIGFGAFYGCTGLTNVTIPDNVTSIGGYTFYGCTGLTNVTIPDNVTSIGSSAFSGCTGLTSVNFNAVNCAKVNGDKSLFDGCTVLQTVTLGDNVKSIPAYAFYNCPGLTTVKVSASVDSIGDRAFSSCAELENIFFQGTDKIDMGNEIFTGSYKATICCKENSYMHTYAKSKGLKYCIIDGNSNLGFVVENDVITKYNGNEENLFVNCASEIGYGAFEGNDTVLSTELSGKVSTIHNRAFKDCSKLEKIIIPISVASIGENAFDGCDKLTIWCYEDSYADLFAKSHGIPVNYITLRLSQQVVSMGETETVTLNATFNTDLNDGTELSWKSDNTNVVTVTPEGKIIAVGVGEATITATSESGLSATCAVKVKKNQPEGRVKAVKLDDIKLNFKKSATLKPQINADDGVKYTVTYTSSDPNVVSVDSNGNVKTLKKGTATVTVTVTDENGNTVQDTCTVKVKYSFGQILILIFLFGWIWYK